MVYSFLMFILVRNAVQYALLALLYQLAQSGASGGLVDLLILRDETGAYNGYSGRCLQYHSGTGLHRRSTGGMVHGKASDHEEQRGYAFKPSEKRR